MRLRLKHHWFKGGLARGPQESATAAAAMVWKISVQGLQNVRDAKFTVDIGRPYIAVLTEFLAFLTVVADRIAYRHDAGEWRQIFTAALVTRLAEIYQENLDYLIGPATGLDALGGHKRRYIGLLNTRMGEYSEFDYGAHGPDFAFQRYFGACVENVLTAADDRRWALDQIMSVQAPAAIEVIERGMGGLLGAAPGDEPG